MRKTVAAAALALLAATPALAQTLQSAGTLQTQAEVRFTAISPDGKQVAGVGSDQKLRIWMLPGGQLVHTLDIGSESINTVAYSQNGRRLAAGGVRGAVRVFDPQNGMVVQELAAPARVDTLALSPEGNLLAIGAVDRPVQLWDLGNRKPLWESKPSFGGSSAASFSPDGKLLASADGDTLVRVYDAATGQLRSSFDALLLESFAIAFSPDSRALLIAGADKVVVAVDPATGKELYRTAKQPDPVGALAVLGDGRTVIAECFDADRMSQGRNTLAWNMESGQSKTLTTGQSFNGGGTLADGRLLLTSSDGNALKLWMVR